MSGCACQRTLWGSVSARALRYSIPWPVESIGRKDTTHDTATRSTRGSAGGHGRKAVHPLAARRAARDTGADLPGREDVLKRLTIGRWRAIVTLRVTHGSPTSRSGLSPAA